MKYSDLNDIYKQRLMAAILRNSVSSDSGCIEWTASRYKNGYGQLNFKIDRKNHSLLAHRIAWSVANGNDVPIGKNVCHSCDNRACVNPEHLWIGTQSENLYDMVSKGRHVSVVKPDMVRRGKDNGRAKLTEVDVLSIRARRLNGETVTTLGAEYKVSPTMISYICNKKSWGHI
jgi:hypothetical protein